MYNHYNNDMRPSKLKTTLAVLRNMLTEEAQGQDRQGRKIPVRARVGQQQVADWLGLSRDMIASIESGRPKVKLMPRHAEELAHPNRSVA